MTIICGEHGSAMCHKVTNSKNNLKLLSRLFRCLLHTSRHWQGATRDATRVKAVDWLEYKGRKFRERRGGLPIVDPMILL